jgi:hypothetical protein
MQSSGDIAELRTDVDELLLDVNELKLDNENNKEDIGNLQQRVGDLEPQVNTNTENIRTNKLDINSVQGEVAGIKVDYATKTYVQNLYAELEIGGHKSLVFDTKQQFLDWLAGTYQRPDGVLPSNLIIGDIILLKEKNVPDYWVSSISSPMTINNFTEYEVKIDVISVGIIRVPQEV